MISYQIFYDIIQDAYNWHTAINTYHATKNIAKNSPAMKIVQQINGLTFDESKQILVPFLQKRNETLEMSPKKFQNIMAQQLEQYFQTAMKKLEQVTGHPVAIQDCAKNRATEIAKINPTAKSPKEDLLFLITTFPNMVVYYEEGAMFSFATVDDNFWGMPLDGILHELLHLQTNVYYRENPQSKASKLSQQDYYILKESLTVLLDESWQPIITVPDCSYPEFQDIRDQLHTFYNKTKDFSATVEYGADLVVKRSITMWVLYIYAKVC